MKPLTINDLRDELKIAFTENNKILVKRIDKTVNDRLSEASDAILGGMQEMFDERDVKIKKLSEDVKNIKQDIKFMHQDIKDIVMDMSDKPSRKQFEEFKSKFDNYPTV